ncbi:hypothetical protein [Devosia rhizoryzae]|uniref:Uncharacterized protein n=1 Tax=Devosia rhizoryzae TaxID=2774137 RepID=A0ABX7C1B5_9HYPH|nr:hypothetical protein [Devosia rhizoryzae]QQR38029.1 hypothetical protein JI748_09470 [Devosia rhizoryzae]
MLVYGDIERYEAAATLAARVSAGIERCRALPPGLARHAELVATFIACSTLVQGVADGESEATGVDDTTPAQDAGATLLLALAQAIGASWDSDFAAMSPVDESALALLSRSGAIRSKLPEGYAFYALYPENYFEAARQSGLGPGTTVIGIRSIGIGLAAMVAAALGAPPAFSIRPVGHPFDRRMSVGQGLAERLLTATGPFAIVDEGPGLSGSSFNCVAGWLVAHGVAEEQIHFFPSHGGDLGHEAQKAHRARWMGARKHVSDMDAVLLRSGRLEDWIATMVGPLTKPMRDLSGGGWRSLVSDLPPADPAMEKRKFLVETESGRYLAKFIGLGDSGPKKLAIAQALSEAGFAPPPSGICHGFMLTPWIQPVATPEAKPPPARVLDYLAFRAGLAPTGGGASLDDLFSMATYNLGQSLGLQIGEAATAALGDPARFAAQPCCTDNRMHRWEWVHGAEGWMKLDGLDHHAAHDLVGCQDIAWDVAGASVELDLSVASLAGALENRLGRILDADFLRSMELCYLGFQIGLWTMAKARNGQTEQPGIDRQIARYGRRVRLLLCSEAEKRS